ncbi:MAG: glycosyltransferase [Microgenomates group bacterium]
MKTAFIYDKWYSQLGGGEVVASHLALCLHQLGYDTTIISGSSVSLDKIKSIQGLDLSSIKFVESFDDQLRLNQITAGANIFINTSFWDYSVGSAEKNYYYCFFPSPIKSQLLKQILSSVVRPYEITSDHKYIFYNLVPSRTYTLKFSLVLPEFSVTNLKNSAIKLENATILSHQITINHFQNKISYKFVYQPLTSSVWFKSKLPLKLYHYPFQNKLFSLLRSGTFVDLKNNLKGFHKIFATSVYTQQWIQKYWHIKSSLLYPPVPLLVSRHNPKKKQICSIGRFTTLGNNKKHEVMIQAFKQLIDAGLLGWELHLAGGLGNEPTSQQYAQNLQHQIGSYPIFLHFSPPRSFIKQMLSESTIYWHAAGFGLDRDKYPEQFEHFGITPLEAISAGCVPVVFAGGGLTEVVTSIGLDPKLHTFHTIPELVSHTKKIIKDRTTLPPNIHKLISSKFSINTFYKNLIKLVT